MTNVAVLASGRGSNLQAILEAQRRGRLGPARVRVVVSDHEDARALTIAREHGTEAVFLDPEGQDREAYGQALVELLEERGIEHVVLAGFMRVLAPNVIRAFDGKLLNIHPSLLPAFPGLHAQRRALEAGVRFTGATTHFVTEEVDAGPIILQSVVPVRPDDTEDTLAQRILRTEHEILPESLRLLAEGRLSVEGETVTIKGEVDVPTVPVLVPEVTP